MAALALTAGCNADIDDAAVPPDADIARVELRLAEHPCVRDLDLWERSYRYSRKMGLFTAYSLNPDFNVVEFHLRRAGTATIVPGRKVMAHRQSGDWPDGPSIQSLDGRFQLDGGKLLISRCEPVARA
jgi:hypothetical protein